MTERKRSNEAQRSVDYEDAIETERVKASYTPENLERNERFSKELAAFCEREHPVIVMNGLAYALVVYFAHYYPEQSLEDFLELMARGYRSEIRRREMQ